MKNFKFAPSAILELLAFNTPKIKGHVTVTTPPFREFFSGIMSGLYLGSCTPNLKFATLTGSGPPFPGSAIPGVHHSLGP